MHNLRRVAHAQRPLKLSMADNVENKLQNMEISEKKKKGKKAKAEAAGDQGDKLTAMDPPPEFLASRQQLWDQLKKEYDDWVAAQERVSIKVTLPDGKVVEGKAWETTPYDVAKGISQGLADNTVIAKVNDVLWDLDRPLEQDAKLQLLKFDDKDGEYVFWHSSAHILGEAMECLYGGHLCYGPPIESGFYYDMWSDRQVSSNDYPVIESRVKQIVKEKQPFERLVMTKENLLKMFEYNEFKQRIINQKIDTPTTTVYKCGPLIDLCRGPHVRHTGKIKSMAVTKNSSTYWEGKADAESLQRIYGISFPDPKQMKEWKHFQEEAAKRNHRKIGQDQELFFFHELSPGSCFFLPKGAHIYNTLVDFMKSEYRKRGFHEVVSPNIYNHRLWETSGHWQHYAENMFQFDVEKEKYALKPMNCPGHCLMFDHRIRSHKELPLRMADFGVLHRNELSGALSGLTRVRRFQQDDAHIFCTPEQIEQEVLGCLEFLKFVYGVFGFTFELKLSTRPDGFLGDPALWETAEKDLATTLDKFGYKWELNPGDGAFYGPKIDITITDALRRPHQCATIQLDFQLPIRFNLGYIGASGDGEKLRPVIIHRAILGSVERMMAILCESYGGKWPFWLSPRQAIVIPVASAFDEYAMQVKQQIFDAGFLCDAELDPSNTLNKKVRNSQLAQYNFILVVGEKEVESKSANVRTRDNKVHGEHSIEKIIERFNSFKETRCLDAEEQF
ncbi:threonine--tRNA ligase 1, cytoplasmic-like isoform X1 [Mercenaria mercenaria]|uniref:threonine--tRNA ligase 1, cytoplasmic-like isoform X1 n=1 Tax=Mercenaria mercenaria TaxID=6596 RepID=UPI00234E5AE9|nr:threonine--tRNA ligase 1, cytoplasmic-like isoform X1 [Mercenaria mercenaria]